MLLGSGHVVGMVTSLGFLEQVLVSAKKPMEEVKFQIFLGVRNDFSQFRMVFVDRFAVHVYCWLLDVTHCFSH